MQLNILEENPKAHICKECMGFCCFRFYIRLPIRDGEIDWDEAFKYSGDKQKKDMEFQKENFQLVKVTEEALGNGIKTCELTCRQYNKETHMCGVYEKRPLLCHRYVCDTAYWMEQVPTRKSFPQTVETMMKEGMDTSMVDPGTIPWCDTEVFHNLTSSNMRYPYGFLNDPEIKEVENAL